MLLNLQKIAQFGTQNRSQTGLKSILEPTLGVEKSVQAAFGLLDASWHALGRAWAPKKLIGIGSWTARGHRGDRFQHAWGPNGRPKGVLKLGPKANQAENGETTKIVDSAEDFLDF